MRAPFCVKIRTRVHKLVEGLHMLRIIHAMDYYTLAGEAGYNDFMARFWLLESRTTKGCTFYPEPKLRQIDDHLQVFGYKVGIRRIDHDVIHQDILDMYDLDKIGMRNDIKYISSVHLKKR